MRRMWSRRVLVALIALATVLTVAFVHVLHSLDEPWIKRHVVERVRSLARLDVDYRVARVDVLSGAYIEGLVVASPPEMRGVAPELARVERVEARWSPWNVLFGRRPPLDQAALHGAVVTVVQDENGRTSFDALFPPPAVPPPPSPSVPLSHQAAAQLGHAPVVASADLGDVKLALVRTARGAVVDRFELGGLALTAKAAPVDGAGAGWSLHAELGSPAAPLDLTLARSQVGVTTASPQTAHARLALTADASSSAASAALDLRMVEQTFATRVASDHWLHAEAELRFDPGASLTTLRLTHTVAGDGAATLDADLQLPDQGDPVVREAHGEVDGARWLRWLPPGLAPVSADQALLQYQVDGLVVGSVVHLSAGGSASVGAALGNVAVEAPGGPLRVRGGKLALRGEPRDGGGVKAKGTFVLTGTQMGATDGEHTAVDDLRLEVDGQQSAEGALDGQVTLTVGELAHAGPPASASAQAVHQLRATLLATGVHPGTSGPLTTTGEVALTLDAAALESRSPGSTVTAAPLALRAHLPLTGHAPYAAELDVRAGRLRVLGAGGRATVDAPAHVDLRAHDVEPDLDHPATSRGSANVQIELGDLATHLDATKTSDALDYTLQATMTTLNALRPLLAPETSAGMPLGRMAMKLRSRGRLAGLATTPELQETTELHLDEPAFAPVSARALDLSLETRGTALRQQIDVDLHADRLAASGSAAADDHLALSATLDRTAPSVKLTLATDGHVTSKLAGALSFAADRRAVEYAIDGHVGGLTALVPLAAKIPALEGLDLTPLEIALTAHGSLLGVVTTATSDGKVTLAPDPQTTAEVRGSSDLTLEHVRWAKGSTAVLSPTIGWHAETSGASPRRTLKSHLSIPSVHLDLGIHDVDLNGLTDDSEIDLVGKTATPDLELKQHFSIKAVEQTLVPEYPLGDLAFALAAERSTDGVVHVSDLKLSNGAGGTTLALSGNVDLGEGRRTLSLTSAVTQDLAHLSTIPDRFKGKGKLAIESYVTSPDFAHYRVRSTVKGEAVSIDLPRAGITVDEADGEVPVTIALVVGGQGVALERTERRAGFSMLRFADQHPLLTRSGVLSIARLKTPLATIAPLVGNLEIDENVISLRQFEMGVRGGTITGLCGVDWEGPKSTLELHVRASGVQSSHGEPFDGNLAVAISAADRTIDGRAEILKIGERHLLDLLDLEDPQHVDAGMNRIRTALFFGYPDSLRLVFDHGFANAHLELGGPARLVNIGDLRGIPMGPIVDRMISKMRAGSDGGDPQ